MRRPRSGDLGRATHSTYPYELNDTRLPRYARVARRRPRGWCGRAHACGRARSLVRLEVRRLLQLVLRHGESELVGLVLGLVARDELERARRQRYVLRADAEEAADAHNVGFDLATLVEQDVAHVTDLLVV